MFAGLMSDWRTIQGSGTSPFVQDRAEWLDLARWGDITLWLEVRALANPGAGSVELTYETSPANDESLFQAMASAPASVTTSPAITQVRLADNPATPLARFVRWRLQGTAAGNWSVTFRIFAMANRGSAGFAPSALALTGYWRADFAGAPWVGTASAGTSGAEDLAAPVVGPDPGTAQNGLIPAAFNGVTQYLGGSALSTFLASSAWSVWFLVYANTAVLDPGPGARVTAPALACDTSAYFIVAFTDSGVSLEMADGLGAASTLTSACAIGGWHLVQCSYDGADLWLRIDSGAASTEAYGNLGSLAAALRVGANYNASALFDGSMLEIGATSAALSLATFDSIKSSINARYGLSL